MRTALLVIVFLLLPQVGCFLEPSIEHTSCNYLTLNAHPCKTERVTL